MHGGPYPRLDTETEQVYSLYYRCAVCRYSVVVFQVTRRGFKFQLTGRSVPFRPEIANEWPKAVKPIVADAYSAAAENDLPAAYYHLRTAIEHYMKAEVKIPTTQKVDGTELCEKYNATLDSRLKSGFPAMSTIYTELSSGLHTREVSTEGFERLCRDLIGHFKGKELFAQYSV